MRKAISVAMALCLTGCATITKGTTQIVAIDTPGVSAASCTLTTPNGPQLVTTPGTVTLSKSAASIPVRCTKECYLEGAGMLASGTEAMAAGNVILGGVIGLGVDAVSGAINKYPDQLTVAMVPDQACRKQAPAPAGRR